MKRLLVIFFCLLGGVIGLLAQPRLERDEMYVGVHAGILASMVGFSPAVEQSALNPYLGPNAGLVFRYSGQKCCGLQVELNYMQRGWHETPIGYRRRLDYVEMPFLTHIWFGRKFRGFVNLGPQVGFLVHESHYGLPEKVQPQHLPLNKHFDWALAAGLGMLYRSIAGVWQLEARFNYSFGDVFANHKTDYFSRSNCMNLSLNLAWFWQVH